MDRRNFIRGSLAAAFLATLAPAILAYRKPGGAIVPLANVRLTAKQYQDMTGEPFTRLQVGDVLTFEGHPHNHQFRVTGIVQGWQRAELSKVGI